MGFSLRRAKFPLVCHKKGPAAGFLGRWGWTLQAVYLTRRRGGAEEDAEKETEGMEVGGFTGSVRWRAEGAEKEEVVRENRCLTRRCWDTTGRVLDAETRRRGERRGEETGGMEGGGFTGSVRWRAEEAEREGGRCPSFARIGRLKPAPPWTGRRAGLRRFRSEEHTYEIQSL